MAFCTHNYAYKFLCWFMFMICINLYISENNIEEIYYNSIILDKKFEKKFENHIHNTIINIQNIDPDDRFYNIVHTYKMSIYNKFKKMVSLKKNIILSTGNIRISLIFYNYCNYFKDYMDHNTLKLFSQLVPFSECPKFSDLYLIINNNSINLLLYPDNCFDFFYEKIE